MVTSVSRRRWASLLASIALLLPSGFLIALPAYAEEAPPDAGIGEPAFEEAVPDPETGLYPGQAAPANDFGPGSPGWITGFTEQEANAPAVAPVPPKTATVKSAPATRTSTRRGVERGRVQASPSGSSTGAASAGHTQPTALAFTGDRLTVQLAVGAAAVLGGLLLCLLGRRRHVGSLLATV